MAQCGLGSIPSRYHMWVEFVVGTRLAQRVFLRVSGSPVFLPPEKPTFPNSNSTWIEDPHEKPATADVASSLNKI